MTNTFRWGPLAKLYLFYFSFSGLYQILVYASGMSNTVGVRDAILMSTIWLIPSLWWPAQTKRMAAVIGLILWASSLVNLGYFMVFGQDFSQSVLFIIFESNLSESLEFLESYYDPMLMVLMLLYGGAMVWLWHKLEPIDLSGNPRLATTLIIAVIMCWPFVNPMFVQQIGWEKSVKRLQNRYEPASPWHLVAGYFKYRTVLDQMQEQLAQNSAIPPLAELHNRNPLSQPTMVLVIGESTNRQRMSLYGYPRPTTPRLDRLREELLVFDHVISPRPYTIESLQQVLTFADQTHPDDYLTKPSLINLMHQAGYQTYWITNQQTQTERNTMLLTFSQQADQQTYLNNNRGQNASQYDGEVIEPFRSALSESDRPKLIVVHLLGTHRKYNYRFPESYRHFTNRDGMPDWVPENRESDYNDYDNAILYNDYVVSELINLLKTQAPNSSLVYFSDHGEEVFDTPNHPFSGRNENAPTTAMYTVPFITWLSPAWSNRVNTNQLHSMLNRPYSLSDFIYSWADLAQIQFAEFEPSRSIFNPAFQMHTRWVGTPTLAKNLKDFDVLFPNVSTNGYHVVMNHF